MDKAGLERLLSLLQGKDYVTRTNLFYARSLVVTSYPMSFSVRPFKKDSQNQNLSLLGLRAVNSQKC